ncbi:hypothetical protein BH09PSE4_BH09PSE4_20890 [soil metagenome]
MFTKSKFLMAAAALSLTASPVLAAAANPAAKLSIAPARVGAKAGKSKAAGGLLIALIAAAAVVAGIVIVASSSDSP